MQTRLRIGTRGSALALAQTNMFVAALARAHGWSAQEAASRTEIVTIKTTGDRVQDRPLYDIGGKGLFAKELEEALLEGRIDAVVHSLKDLPGLLPEGFKIACHLPREDARDVLVAKSGKSLHDCRTQRSSAPAPSAAARCSCHARPDLTLTIFRGNVDTRLRKIASGEADATILALAGLKRLGLEAHAAHVFSHAEMLPAVAQGAIGIEVLAANAKTIDLLGASERQYGRSSRDPRKRVPRPP